MSSADSYQDVLFLGEDRPLVIRLHLVVDGKPFVEVWEEYVRGVFALADRDANGVLAADEIRSPAESTETLAEEMLSVLAAPGLMHADVNPADGELSFAEFAMFVRHRGGPFQPPPVVAAVSNEPSSASAYGQASPSGSSLFTTLDRNADGQIGREELAAGSESIRKLDFDGDGASSVDELDHRRGAFGAPPANQNASMPVPVYALPPGASSTELIDKVVSAYGGAQRQSGDSLTITRLGDQDEQFADFDADRNGRLDREELRYWLLHPRPHVELVVRVGSRGPDQQPVEVKTPPALADLTVKASDMGLLNLVTAEDVHLEFGVAVERRTEASVKNSFSGAFQRADRDGNGYLEADEVAGNPLFEDAFDRFDRDGDGKVFEEELLVVVTGRILAALSRTAMTAANRGKDLFEILDTNRDRRVTRRELLGAERRFDLWDVDADSKLAEHEVPQLYQLVFDRGTPQFPGLRFAQTMPERSTSATAAAPAGVDRPVWFQKMDRNNDGDVSRREFLGTVAQFRDLDSDDNELIDVIEAGAPFGSDDTGCEE